MPQPLASQRPEWHALDGERVRELLRTPDSGLTAVEAEERLSDYGANALPVAPPTPWWRVLARQFVSPLIAILAIAAAITAAQQHWVDTAAIGMVLALNAALGFAQERKAEHDVRALQSLASTNALVLRDGVEHVIESAALVPGDLVKLESGAQVPADLRLIAVNGLSIDESMLTGESIAVAKGADPVAADAATGDRLSLAFSGTFVTSGRGTGIVVATGAETQLGAISGLVVGRASKTPLQKLTHALERRIGLIVLATIVFVFGVGLLSGYAVDEMFRTAVALAVATIPESLPIILTVAMSVGVSRMARRGAIVRTLPSVETLGSTTVIASDKTGTLTQNRLTVEQLWTAHGFESPTGPLSDLALQTLRGGALTNEAQRGHDGTLHGDAVDVAMAEAALATGAVHETERAADPVAHTPYEPQLRYSQTVRRRADGRSVLYVKGSPETLAAMSTSLWGEENGYSPGRVLEANETMAQEGLRVIAVAFRVLEPHEDATAALADPAGLTLLGMEGMADPPRPDVAAAIADCRRAGVAVKMITGDHPITAEAIARRLGIETSSPPLTGAEIAVLSDDELAARLTKTNVAARVSPQDKLRIVRILEDGPDTVAVTGDGVNDAPALRAAAIGVSMGRSGTDVAREASDLVLTDDNFTTIVHAIEQGRVTFAAIRKATFFLLSNGVAGVVALSINLILDQPLIFLPVQILWINLVTCGIQDIALALEPAEGRELHRPPRSRTEGVLSRTLWIRTFVTGVWMGAFVVLVYGWALHQGYDDQRARSLAMVTFVLFNFFQVGSARAEYKSLFALSPFRNKVLLATAVGAVVLLWAVMSWPVSAELLGLTQLSWAEWLGAGAVASTVLIIVELEKLARHMRGASR
ncbi:cation-translocating P-type ATPase [Ruicaihuangia caeni]|uniref:HAD-IC family P-type ATPase n=1 Tax=Ruicaihuangia caeni TaxID=3042517 RepID=A0AAW6T8L2_9MICO|nr:HAD-IC family P-type ATPase [Klugiella sp. YN-L-19]MDI2098659.1 HAD-IC family P-type ATPase [Klugiella sp. YN-L-19]